jgi:7-cyano-7-deazaguanine synthase in queuosine biosynthesis
VIAPEYHYRVDATGHIHSRIGELWVPGGSVFFDGVRRTSCLGPFDTSERDLLRVMTSIVCADRLSPRKSVRLRGAIRNFAWQRTIRLRIAVEDPQKWERASSKLADLLHFMTDDSWELTFGTAERPAQQESLPILESERPTEVALFSGGLDSVAGLFARSRANPGIFLAVSACGNEVRGRLQTAALDALRDLGVEVRSFKLTVQLQNTSRARSRIEATQRTRGLLFLAMGAATASHLSVSSFSIYETGVGCINLPMTSAQVGAQGTRAMHPRTLALFEELLVSVLDHPVRVIAPFFLHTKGELCREAGTAIARLARVTMSCDEGEGHKLNALEHCGVCTSCLFRRIAVFSCGLNPDPTKYRDLVMRRHGNFELGLFDGHASQLLLSKTFADLIAIAPDARFASQLPVESAMTRVESERQVVDMYQRYAREVIAFMENARPALNSRPKQHRKETAGDLFAAAG